MKTILIVPLLISTTALGGQLRCENYYYNSNVSFIENAPQGANYDGASGLNLTLISYPEESLGDNKISVPAYLTFSPGASRALHGSILCARGTLADGTLVTYGTTVKVSAGMLNYEFQGIGNGERNQKHIGVGFCSTGVTNNGSHEQSADISIDTLMYTGSSSTRNTVTFTGMPVTEYDITIPDNIELPELTAGATTSAPAIEATTETGKHALTFTLINATDAASVRVNDTPLFSGTQHTIYTPATIRMGLFLPDDASPGVYDAKVGVELTCP